MNRRLILKGLPFFLILLIFSGCVTNPGKIAQDPQRWDGRQVAVRGTVGRVFNLPLTDVSIFLLENPKGNVSVVTVQERQRGKKTVVRGEVWAFPERGMVESSASAVEAVEDFLVDHKFVKREKAREMSALVLTAVRKLAEGLGHTWFIIEK